MAKINVIVNFKQMIFDADDSDRIWVVRRLLFCVRMVYAIGLRFVDKRLHLQSTSLAYTTLLSLVPSLAVTFSVLKGFGVQNQLEPMVMQALEPLGESGVQIGQNMLNYVNNMSFAVLGSLGIAFLFWTVVSLLQRVEEAFNAIWNVPGIRSWNRRFSDYLSATLVGPVFIVSALGLAAVVLKNETVQRIAGIEPFGSVILGLSRLLPYTLICLAFAFLYSFMTNTRVRLVPALVGGVFASFAWYGVGHLFANLVANSSRYSAIYSSLAAVVLFIIWVNVGWLIILVGAHIARYWQYPQLLLRQWNGSDHLDAHSDIMALNVMTLIGRSHYFGEPRWTRDALAARGCGGSFRQLEGLLQIFKERGLIVATHEEPEEFLPGRAIDTILIRDIAAVSRSGEAHTTGLPAVKEIVDQIEAAISDRLGEQTLKDLVLANDHGTHAAPKNVSRGHHDRLLHPGPLPEGQGNQERARRDFHGKEDITE